MSYNFTKKKEQEVKVFIPQKYICFDPLEFKNKGVIRIFRMEKNEVDKINFARIKEANARMRRDKEHYDYLTISYLPELYQDNKLKTDEEIRELLGIDYYIKYFNRNDSIENQANLLI